MVGLPLPFPEQEDSFGLTSRPGLFQSDGRRLCVLLPLLHFLQNADVRPPGHVQLGLFERMREQAPIREMEPSRRTLTLTHRSY